MGVIANSIFADSQLKHHVAVGPVIDPETWRLTIPAKPGCFLLTDEHHTPILLGTAANMRAVLVGRLAGAADHAEPTKRVDYRQVTRHIHYRPAFSRFESDWCYIENAYRWYPREADRLTRRWRVPWLAVNPADRFPRFVATNNPRQDQGRHFGPLPTQASARALIEMLEDLFDLCRYHEILTQTPHGQACAYKEMGKCPAPCDGSIPLSDYHQQMADARDLLIAPQHWRTSQQSQMQAAAGALAFEQAGRIKAAIDQAALLAHANYAKLKPLDQHRYLLVQPGRRKGCARLFVVLPQAIRFLGEVQRRDRQAQLDWLCARLPDAIAIAKPTPSRMTNIAGWHMLRSDAESGIWLPLEDASPQSIANAVEHFAHASTR